MSAVLVQPGWVMERLGQPEVVVFDATKFLPGEGKDGQAGFAAGHVAGARFFDIDLFADPESGLPHMVPTAGRFARLMGAAGVRETDTVVFYDQKGQASAARGWWLLRLFGHAGVVALLDGGLPGWVAAGGAMEVGETVAVVVPYAARWQAGRVRGLGDMVANLATGEALVLDARPVGRFEGSAPEPRPGLPSGHIPGSRNVPAGSLVDGAGRFLAPEILRGVFAAVGADGSRPVVTSCGTGVTASMLAFGMGLAGLAEPAVYDGSWTEWASTPGLAVEKGSA